MYTHCLEFCTQYCVKIQLCPEVMELVVLTVITRKTDVCLDLVKVFG